MTKELKKAVNDVNKMVDEWYIREEENVGTVIGSLLNVIVFASKEIEEHENGIFILNYKKGVERAKEMLMNRIIELEKAIEEKDKRIEELKALYELNAKSNSRGQIKLAQLEDIIKRAKDSLLAYDGRGEFGKPDVCLNTKTYGVLSEAEVKNE